MVLHFGQVIFIRSFTSYFTKADHLLRPDGHPIHFQPPCKKDKVRKDSYVYDDEQVDTCVGKKGCSRHGAPHTIEKHKSPPSL